MALHRQECRVSPFRGAECRNPTYLAFTNDDNICHSRAGGNPVWTFWRVMVLLELNLLDNRAEL
jgi:hypothetical protein